MIATMINDDEEQKSFLFLVIENEQLDRMRKADPITLETRELGGVLGVPKYPNRLGMVIAYEKDDVELYRMAREGSFGDLLRYIMRGKRWIQGQDGTENSFPIKKAKSK